jgi:hypothetical protein
MISKMQAADHAVVTGAEVEDRGADIRLREYQTAPAPRSSNGTTLTFLISAKITVLLRFEPRSILNLMDHPQRMRTCMCSGRE